MAEIVRTAPVGAVDEAYLDDASRRPRISWGAIFAGAVSALALWLLLYAFGLAVGLTALDPNNPGSLKSSGIFTGIWGLVAPLISLFVGGFVAGRGAGVFGRGEGAVHGLVMWGLATVIGAVLVMMTASAVIRGVAAVGRTAVQAGGAAIGAATEHAGGVGALAQQAGIDPADALRPVNQRLQTEGKPPINPPQIEAAAKSALQGAVREGRVDRDMLVQSIAQNTALSRADAEDVANRLTMQIDNAKAQVGQRAQAVQVGALKAAEQSGKAFWGLFGALLLGLIAAVIGGAIGTPHLRSRRREVAIEPTPAPHAPPRAPREVYP